MPLDTDTLERLATDRAVGELAPDTAELLNAYLDHDPGAGRLAQQVERTVGLARQAMGPERLDVSLPPFAGLARYRTRLWLRHAALAAACAMVGLGLGLWLGPVAPTHGTDGAQPVARHSQAADDAGSPGFWSVSRLLDRSAERDRSVHLVWDSPVAKPRLERSGG